MATDIKNLKGHANNVYYDGDGNFSSSSRGCGCCSTYYNNLTKEEALQVAGSMIEHWMAVRNRLRAVTEEKMREDVLRNANL